MSNTDLPPEDRISQLKTAVGPSTSPAPSPDPDYGHIGPFRILEKRGEGGMGVVYLAEQTEPVKRQVALKVIKLGMATKEVIARFEVERQALAMMDHQAIASIYDAGTTGDGRSYFVMEYVEGSPITEYCNRNRLTNRERIELFLQVCEGVQYAHQKAVIHRDLKPSNVLVTLSAGRPVVKIIDFGLAKALEQRLTDRTLWTEVNQMVGTLEYMSPEQAGLSLQDVDTRADVYSLGVMLYEILVGTLPFASRELREAAIDEARRKIREQDPPRPSSRLSSSRAELTDRARLRRTEPDALRRELKGDLDWIIMRALEKDRSRRYGSPSEMAADLARFLRFEPVLARAPSARYRAGKFVRRHRLGVAAAAAFVLVLTAGAVASTVGFVRALQAERRAREEAEARTRVADFLKDLFRVSNPSEARGNSITARELLDKAAGTLDGQLSDQPAVQADLAEIMGEVYLNLGLYPQAESLTAKALEIRRRVLGPEHRDTLRCLSRLAATYGLQDRHEEGRRLFTEVLEIRKRRLGPEHPDTLSAMMGLASAYYRVGRYAESEDLFSRAVEIQRRVLGPEDPATMQSMHNLAVTYLFQRRLPEAERAALEDVELRRRVNGPDHPETLLAVANLVQVYLHQRRFEEAEHQATQLLNLERRVLGPEHPDVLTMMTNLALIYQGQGKFDEAERLDRETLEIQRRVLGPEHSSVLWSMNNLALGYQSRGRLEEAERLHEETLEIRRRVLGPTHPDTLVSYYNLACVAARKGDRPGAMAWLRQDVDGGDLDADTMERDAELESLHGPEFDALLDRVRRNAAAARVGETPGH